MSRFVLPSLLFLALVPVAVGCSSGGEAAPAEQSTAERAANVRVLELARTDLVETVQLTGPLRAVRGTDVSTEEAGVVEALPAAKGRRVAAGQVVVALDRRLLEAEEKSAEAARILREYNEERTRKLYEANSVSKQEMLLVHTELEQARQNERVAELRFERAAIVAPFDGIVTDHYVEVGELVAPGQRVARVVDPFTLELEGAVTEREVRWLREGARATIAVDGIAGGFDARVAFVSLEANPVSGKFPVEIVVDNRDLRLRAGVVGRARVVKEVHADVIAIPRDALVRADSGPAVYLVEDDHARLVPVRPGADQGVMVVVESGLEVGQRLVVRGQRQLQPGAPVLVQETATARDGSVATDPAEVREVGGALEGLETAESARRVSAGGERR